MFIKYNKGYYSISRVYLAEVKQESVFLHFHNSSRMVSLRGKDREEFIKLMEYLVKEGKISVVGNARAWAQEEERLEEEEDFDEV